MKIEIVSQVIFEEINPSKKDILICASGYETRSIYVAQNLGERFHNKIVFGINSYLENSNRIKNDKFYREQGFKYQIENEDTGEKIILSIHEIINSSSNSVNIYIDYSSMPRTWYSELIRYLGDLNFKQNVSVIFLYSEGKFVKPSDKETYNLHVEPLRGFTYASVPEKPTALIIGLGYETRRPLGLKEYFDASKMVLFLTDEQTSGKYYSEVIKKNKILLETVEKKNPNDVFYYPVNDQEFTFFNLERVCKEIQKSYRIVIAPCGPKFFTLCSLLVAFKNTDLDVWRISAGEGRVPFDRKPSGEIMCLKVDFNEG